MSHGTTDRRTFLKHGIAAGAAGLSIAQWASTAQGRTLGANDRISVGMIGCGGRGQYLAQHGVKASGENAAVIAVCDIWKPRLEAWAGGSEKVFGVKPEQSADFRKLLDSKDIDAVIIATPDHQHSAMATAALEAGKHVYCEKPIIGLACDLPDLNRLYDTAKSAKVVIQNGTQGITSDGARAIKQLIADGKLGKLFRVESTETLTVPYWAGYPCPKDASETDWKAFLFNRADRPFDATMHGKWMGYREITAGTIGGWMTHFINFVHYVTGCSFPVSCTAWGGRYALTNDPKCTAPDQTMVMLDYAEGFHTQFTSHFGSDINNETTTFMFEKGCVKGTFGHSIGNPIISSEGVNDSMKPEKMLPSEGPPALTAHVKNWLECARSGKQPNANMELGYKQGIAVIMGDVSWNTGKRSYFDAKKREVHT